MGKAGVLVFMNWPQKSHTVFSAGSHWTLRSALFHMKEDPKTYDYQGWGSWGAPPQVALVGVSLGLQGCREANTHTPEQTLPSVSIRLFKVPSNSDWSGW